jgi:hypothetical protein
METQGVPRETARCHHDRHQRRPQGHQRPRRHERPKCRELGIWLLRACHKLVRIGHHVEEGQLLCEHATGNDPASAAPSWNGCLTAQCLNQPTRSWVPAGSSRERPPRTGVSPRPRTATRIGSAGSSFAATFQEIRSFITDVASTRAGIQTIWSSSPTPRINGTCARHTASTAIRCRVTICGSARMACEPAGRAMRPTSGRSGSAMTAEASSAYSP